MVIVSLIGGLGNQLFQYAAARRLAFKLKCSLKLDITGFETYKLHKYSLNHFNIPQDFATLEEINYFRPHSLTKRMLRRLIPNHHYKVVKERFFNFDPSILEIAGDVYLDGYWQSEKYFEDIGELLRQELSVKTLPDAENQALIDDIRATEAAVSIHVRRGDYASNAVTQQVHGLSPLEYYESAIHYVTQVVPQPHFFIFSDDPSWVRHNLHIEQAVTYVEHNDANRNYEDLRLMSLCRHHIIANSTFSWWGAWLGRNPAKRIIALQRWFNTAEKNTKDLIPADWIRL